MIKYIIPTLAIGAAAGYLNSNWSNTISGFWVSDYLFNGLLILLLFVMGLTFGMDEEAVTKMRRTGPKILVIPFAIVFGSILGGVVSGLVLGINMVATTAVSAGYGWYTLAGPLLGQLFGAEWGALGFAANFLRELLTIITISLVVRFDKYVPVAFGGATSMDTTLPVTVRYCGSEMLITAFSSGFTLSLIAPITIIAIAALG